MGSARDPLRDAVLTEVVGDVDGSRTVAQFAEPGAAVAAALACVRSAGPQARVSIDVAGAGGRAALLCSITRRGEVVMSRSVRDLAGDRLPAGARLEDLGVHRLSDLGPPEHVWRLAHPDLADGSRPPVSLSTLPNNLPYEPTTFVGRERELAEVRRLLERRRLLTLTGAGGCGKTRLAVQVAASAIDRFSDGAWVVELAAVSDPELVGQTVADAVGVRPLLPWQSGLDAALGYLATRRALVLLDNCEHLLDAAAQVAEAVTASCPDVTLLVTSRAPLGLPGEATWRVPSLSLPDAGRLFIARATMVRPDVAVTNADAVAEICSALDGIPLAIELAAARVGVMSLEQVAAGLSDRFRLLRGGGRRAPRQRTLQASVDWSHDLLTAAERTLFRRLGVFAGRFALERVEDVAAFGELQRASVLDVLASLVDKSLVAVDEHDGAVRYRQAETVREYALDRLAETGELDRVRTRHMEAFLALVERLAPDLSGARERGWLDLIDPDGPNLTAALGWATVTDGGRALRLCSAAYLWWRMRGLFAAGESACARALDSAGSAPAPLRARVLWQRADLLALAGRDPDATATAEASLAIAEEAGDESGMARALAVMGRVRFLSDPAGCRPVLERARELARRSGDDWCLVGTAQLIAFGYNVCDEYDEAERLLEESFPAIQRMGCQEFVAWHWLGLSYRHMTGGDRVRFNELAGRALAAAREVGDPVTEGLAHAYIGTFEFGTGMIDRALARVERSREQVIASGAGMALPHTERLLARVLATKGRFDEARDVLESLIASGAVSGWPLGSAMMQLADVMRVAGDASSAEEWGRRAAEENERVGNRLHGSWSKAVLGLLAIERGDLARAEALLQDALAERAEHGLRLWLPETLDGLAMVAERQGRYERAARMLGAVEAVRSEVGSARWAPDEPAVNAMRRRVRAALGDDEFRAAWQQGARLRLDEAIAWVRRGRGARSRQHAGWESLTPTELEVARHAAAGLTNPEIGEAMFISRPTVKAHLSHIYAKLGVRNRSQLTAEVGRRQAA
jgi:predicted ATPase/DNA-binding CsgD family transcriptional regulator